MKRACLTLLFALLAAMPASLYAGVSCIDTDGEALIVNGDKPAAKIEAVARAKWAAIEQSVGVNVKAQSVVQNFALVDDAIMKQIKGVVTGHKLISEESAGDVYKVKINACIEPANAGEALASLSLNNSIAVFLPATKPRERAHETRDVHDEANILSETVIGALAEQGFTVVDVAPSGAADAAAIEKAMKSGNFMTLRSMMYKFLSNLLLIGKADYTISTKKNEDIGFGTKMPFQNVTVRLTYRLVAKDPSSGKMIIVAAGTEEAKGLAKNAEDATAKGLKGVAEKLTPAILEKVSKHIKGIARKISVKVEGISDVSANFALKDILQNTSWVTNVEEKGLGDFIVSYPENPIYLANSVEQKGFKVTKFTPYQIELIQLTKP